MTEGMLLKLKDGKEYPVSTCTCGRCKNQWYILDISDEFLPDYCCYCGMKFDHSKTVTTVGEK